MRAGTGWRRTGQGCRDRKWSLRCGAVAIGEGTGPVAGPVFKTALSPLVGDGRFDSFPSPPKPLDRHRQVFRNTYCAIPGPHRRRETRSIRSLDLGWRQGAKCNLPSPSLPGVSRAVDAQGLVAESLVSRKPGFRAAAHTVGCIRRNRLSSRSRSLHRPARAGSKSGREVHRRELRQEGTGWLLHNLYCHIFGSGHSIC